MMKKHLILLALSGIGISLMGQGNSADTITSGKITYEQKVKFEFKRNGGDAPPPGMNMAPRERKSIKELLFTMDATLFEDGKATTDNMEMQPERGPGMMFGRMGRENDAKTYTDLTNNTIVEQHEFMNRFFCIEKPKTEEKWKVTGNQKAILGYQCFEAFTSDTGSVKTFVWFTPSISIKGGPAKYSNLPGMVLEVNVNNGSRTYVATSIVSVPSKKLKIERPEGKKITEEEYKVMVDKKRKEMEQEFQQRGPGGMGGAPMPGM
jgi:GLPGLI family protein